jgi:hypothetical protein
MSNLIDTENKLLAAQIEKDCPDKLHNLARRIKAHLDKARTNEEKAQQHYTAAAQYLNEAKELCDTGAVEATSGFVPQGNSECSPEQSAKDMEAKHAANDVADEREPAT